jgi:hypothetical protein
MTNKTLTPTRAKVAKFLSLLGTTGQSVRSKDLPSESRETKQLDPLALAHGADLRFELNSRGGRHRPVGDRGLHGIRR